MYLSTRHEPRQYILTALMRPFHVLDVIQRPELIRDQDRERHTAANSKDNTKRKTKDRGISRPRQRQRPAGVLRPRLKSWSRFSGLSRDKRPRCRDHIFALQRRRSVVLTIEIGLFALLIETVYVSTNKPSYLAELVSTHTPARELRSSLRRPYQLHVPNVRTAFGSRAFRHAAPAVSLWNCLPSTVTDTALPIETFKSRLKTFLYNPSFRCWSCYRFAYAIRRHLRRHMMRCERFLLLLLLLCSHFLAYFAIVARATQT